MGRQTFLTLPDDPHYRQKEKWRPTYLFQNRLNAEDEKHFHERFNQQLFDVIWYAADYMKKT
ncbi:MAG: hypothetical protein ABIC95_00125 [archaeon]